MKLVEALEIVREPAPIDAQVMDVGLACGFTPLHLETFLAAELRRALPETRIELTTGLYDDLPGTLRRFENGVVDTVAVVVEWADIDPRLGLRRLGGWRIDEIDDVVASASQVLGLLLELLAETARHKAVICCLPTLPLPPVFRQRPAESGAQELQLRSLVASLALELSAHPGIRTVSPQALDVRSPPSLRRDVQSELATGFPYSLAHASAVAAQLGSLIAGPSPKKGLITDLDDTLWAGVAGEVGARNVSWSLEGNGQAHGLYQQLLASLASAGVLIAAASKNEPEVVDDVFEREDLLLPKDSIFPIEVSWEPKSRSVETILATWNVAPDDVVFVDDSPMELAEVRDVFPGIVTVHFAGGSGEVWDILVRLRDLLGKETLTSDDALRSASLRAGARVRAASTGPGHSLDTFLRAAEGKIEFAQGTRDDPRALELINKTNQFTLNGQRLTRASLGELLNLPSAYLLTAAYEDKFGTLGTIAAVLGHSSEDGHVIDRWVLSCRAFSRQIEHHTLSYLFDELAANELLLSYAPTERNGPLREFLESLTGTPPDAPTVRLTRQVFLERAPAPVHVVSSTRR